MNALTGLQILRNKTETYLKTIKKICCSNNWTISVAESVTSGSVQLLLSSAADAGDFFQGGITTYNSAQKTLHLGIEPIYADCCNGVDKDITHRMAFKVSELFRSQIGIAITGYAVKVPEKNIRDLFAYAVIIKDQKLLLCTKLKGENIEGIDLQWHYAHEVIKLLAQYLKKEASINTV